MPMRSVIQARKNRADPVPPHCRIFSGRVAMGSGIWLVL